MLTFLEQLVITYPISQGQTINAAAIVFSHQNAGTTHEGPWVMDVDHEELVRNFVGWEPEAQSILRVSSMTETMPLL